MTVVTTRLWLMTVVTTRWWFTDSGYTVVVTDSGTQWWLPTVVPSGGVSGVISVNFLVTAASQPLLYNRVLISEQNRVFGVFLDQNRVFGVF